MKHTRGDSEDVQKQEKMLKRQRKKNARAAKKIADELYPNEKWVFVKDGIWRSPRKKIGEKYSYQVEKRDAEILYSFGSVTYLVQEDSRSPGPKFDAIVDGLKMEFKNIHGKSISTLQEHFFTSRSQAPNVFINLEKSCLTKQEIMSALYGARNNTRRYERKNKFQGGLIILKIKGWKNLIYLNVDSLKISQRQKNPSRCGG